MEFVEAVDEGERSLSVGDFVELGVHEVDEGGVQVADGVLELGVVGVEVGASLVEEVVGFLLEGADDCVEFGY